MAEAAPLYRPRLTLHVVWHPAFQRGEEIAERLYQHFTRDPSHPNSRGLGIPLFYHTGTAPTSLSIDDAHHTAIVALIDDEMVVADDWGEALANHSEDCAKSGGRHRVFPVAFSANAYRSFHPGVTQSHFIRLDNLAHDAQWSHLLITLTHELCRLIIARPRVADETNASTAGSPVKLFISHAKRDGLGIAEALRDYVERNHALDTFFDALDIAPGFAFEQEINQHLERAAMVVIQTDAYASRVWCQHEVLRAKRGGRPVVVVNALEAGEFRSFPYCGNAPTLRWRNDDPERFARIIGLVLREVLRVEYFQRHFEDLRLLFGLPPTVQPLAYAPELLTALALRNSPAEVPYYVYPDPPLGREELSILAELDGSLRLRTPINVLANV